MFKSTKKLVNFTDRDFFIQNLSVKTTENDWTAADVTKAKVDAN